MGMTLWIYGVASDGVLRQFSLARFDRITNGEAAFPDWMAHALPNGERVARVAYVGVDTEDRRAARARHVDFSALLLMSDNRWARDEDMARAVACVRGFGPPEANGEARHDDERARFAQRRQRAKDWTPTDEQAARLVTLVNKRARREIIHHIRPGARP